MKIIAKPAGRRAFCASDAAVIMPSNAHNGMVRGRKKGVSEQDIPLNGLNLIIGFPGGDLRIITICALR